MTTTKPAAPLDLAQFEGHAADFMQTGKLLAECRAQRDQIAALQADKAKLREALDTQNGHVWAWSRRLLDQTDGTRTPQELQHGALLTDDCRIARAALAATQGGRS